MRLSALKALPTSRATSVCLACRIGSFGLHKERRFQHARTSHNQIEPKLPSIRDGSESDQSEVLATSSEVSDLVGDVVPFLIDEQ